MTSGGTKADPPGGASAKPPFVRRLRAVAAGVRRRLRRPPEPAPRSEPVPRNSGLPASVPPKPFDGVSLQDAMDRNLATVADACTRAGVHYFVVRNVSPNRHAVAVAEEDGVRLARALAADDVLIARDESVAPVRSAALAGTAEAPGPVWRVFREWRPSGSSIVIGATFGCTVELWRREGDVLVAPAANPVATRVDTTTARRTTVRVAGRDHPSFDVFTVADHFTDFDFPIDVVYTWVDDCDPQWRSRKLEALAASQGGAHHPESYDDARYHNRDELRYSLRSLHTFAPWYRRIFLVTDRQVPAWLDTRHPAITVVDHTEIFGDQGTLPTFNSRAIEARLHHIPDLAEHYVYMNDDVFFGRRVRPELLFHTNGMTKFFPSKTQIPDGRASQSDHPIDATAKNCRDFIATRFGRRVTQKMKHTPHANRRSLLFALEAEQPDLLRRIAANQFRHWTDISVATTLYHYYAYFTGGAVPGTIKYDYINLTTPDIAARLARLGRQWGHDAFCLNDTASLQSGTTEVDDMVGDFLPAHLPFRAPWELEAPG